MLGTAFLLLRTFFFPLAPMTQHSPSSPTWQTVKLPLPNLLPPPAIEMDPWFRPRPSLLPPPSLSFWPNWLPRLPCLCPQPWPLPALNILFQLKQGSSTRMIHSQCQLYQTITIHHTPNSSSPMLHINPLCQSSQVPSEGSNDPHFPDGETQTRRLSKLFTVTEPKGGQAGI